MEFGIQVIGDYDHVRTVAGITEEAGLAAVALADHYLYGRSPDLWATPAYDSLVQAAALGRDTSEVEIVMLVSPITFRHPAVYAKSMSTIDEISNGRFAFGLGTGWHEGEHEVFGFEFPPVKERFAWLEDALGYLRVYLDDPAQGYDGTRWSLAAQELAPRPRTDLRLVVGGGGEVRTPTLVGTFADEYNLYHHTAEGVEQRLGVMRSAAEAAGRNPDDILITTCYPMVGGADEAEIESFLADHGAPLGLSGSEVRELYGDRLPVVTWDEHAEHIDALRQLGFARVYLQVLSSVPWAIEGALRAVGAT